MSVFLFCHTEPQKDLIEIPSKLSRTQLLMFNLIIKESIVSNFLILFIGSLKDSKWNLKL